MTYFSGGAGNETFNGTADTDYAYGNAGNDRLNGLGGDDYLVGGEGTDIVDGGVGNDLLVVAQPGDIVAGDRFIGGAGVDRIVVQNYYHEETDLTGVTIDADVEEIESLSFTHLSIAQFNQFDRLYGVFKIEGTGTFDVTGDRLVNGTLWFGAGDDIVTAAGNQPDWMALSGGGGNDRLIGSEIGDDLKGEAGNDRLEGRGGNDYLIGGEGNDVVLGGLGDDTLYDGLGDDTLDGGAGNDVIQIDMEAGFTTADHVTGGAGIDRLYITTVGSNDFDLSVLDIADDFEEFLGANSHVTTTAERLAHFQYFEARAVTITTGGSLVFSGSFQVREFTLSDAGNSVDLRAATGPWGGYVAGGAGADIILGTPNRDYLSGTGGNDTVRGGEDDDTLSGGSGVDTVDGGAGNDALHVAEGETISVGDRFTGGAGVDTLFLEGTDYGYEAQIVDLTMALIDGDIEKIDGDSMVGARLKLAQLAGLSTIDLQELHLGDAGAVDFSGRETRGYLYLNAAGNQVTLADGNGFHEVVGGAGDDTVVGSSWGANLKGNGGDDVLTSSSGEDVLYGGDGNDVLDAGAGQDSLDGGAGEDQILAGPGNDYIDGGAGADELAGGAGDDSYVVDANDLIVELSGQGNDRITSPVSFVLNPGAEIEILGTTDYTRIDAINFTGNEFANELHGNWGANVLDGGGGVDELHGSSGGDTYVVDDARDKIVEVGDLGASDVVLAKASYALAAGVQVEILLVENEFGVAAIDLAGNEFANLLVGNAGGNVLDGGGGVDELRGLGGDDTYVIDTAADVIVEFAGGGINSVRTGLAVTLSGQVENLTLIGTDAINGTGHAGDNVMVGNVSANLLRGEAGNDTLEGGGGADTLEGGAGADTFRYRSLTDSVGGAADTINFFETGIDKVDLAAMRAGSVSWTTTGTTNAVTVETTTGTMMLTIEGVIALSDFVLTQGMILGTAGDDQLAGTDAADIFDGGLGADVMTGGLGNDYYYVDQANDSVVEAAGGGGDTVESSVTLTLGAEVEALVLAGTAAISGTGNALANVLAGNAAANSLDGGAGADTMNGGLGNDSYVVDNALDKVIETNAAGGTDLVTSSVSFSLGTSVENLTLAGSAAINGTGNGLANKINGNGGANILNGGIGADTMQGGLGNDTYVLDNAADKAIEGASAGTDTIQVSFAFTLGANFENLTLTGASAINGTGNTLANVILGNGAANVLNGGVGADTMNGGAGGDSYLVDNVGDQVIETSAAGGTDNVQSSVSFTLGAYVENLTLTGTGAANGTGNGLVNILTGNAAANTLNGGLGADTMNGGLGNDSYVVDNALDKVIETSASGGNDNVTSSVSFTLGANIEHLTLAGSVAINATGNTLANILTGNGGANILDGGMGADTMQGGLGNDSYVVDNGLDKVIETSTAGGTDKVTSSVSFSLGTNVEQLILTGTAAINGTGNGLANAITGNDGANVLNGAAGADTMTGGNGNDAYVVDNALDKVIETSAAGGIDRVTSSVSFTLGNNVENLTLAGSAAIDGTGNGLVNTILGNGAANILNGAAGADTMQGGLGSDTYVVDNVLDRAIETSVTGGADLVRSSVSFTLGGNVENLILLGSALIDGTGNNGVNSLTGNSAANILKAFNGNDVIDGGAGNDELHGGAGNDSLNGGTGADGFVFNTALNASTNLDHILDFVHAIDEIRLENAVFTTLAAGALSASAFRVGAAALDADDRILYDAATGALYYDRDGSGATAAVQFATLDNMPATLNATDFLVI